jgi:hypothetical protein
MGCLWSGNFSKGCSLRGGREEYKQKGLLVHWQTIKEKYMGHRRCWRICDFQQIPKVLLLPLVPDRVSGDCPDPEITGTGSGNVCERGRGLPKPSLIQPRLMQEEVAVEFRQQWRKHVLKAPYLFMVWHKQSQWPTEWELVYIHHDSILHLHTYCVCVVLWVCNYISSRRINHHGALLHALIPGLWACD